MSYRQHLVELCANADAMHKVRRQIARRLPAQDVDDVMQDTLLKAWKYIDAFRGDCAISTWLVTIAVNTAKNHYKLAASRAQPLDVDTEELFGDACVSVARRLHSEGTIIRKWKHPLPIVFHTYWYDADAAQRIHSAPVHGLSF